MRSALAILIVVLASSLAACGDDPEPEMVIVASDFSDAANGVAFRAPAGAVIGQGRGTQVVVLRRGASTLVVSRFDREGERLPRGKAQFERAATALEAEYGRRWPARVEAFSDVAASGIIVFTDDGANKSGQHVHFYERGIEYVVDCVAPTKDFKRAQTVLCDPVVGTIVFSRPES